MQQHTHQSSPFKKRNFPIILVCDNVRGPANIGSLFRLADAFGISKLICCGHNPDLKAARLKKTARETQRFVSFSTEDDIVKLLSSLKNEGHHILGLEITDSSTPLQEATYPKDAKLVLVLGNEKHGLSEESLGLCTKVHHIELYGENSSINVSTSAAIALFELTKLLSQ